MSETQEQVAGNGRAVVPEEALVKGSSLWRDAWRRLLKNRAAMAGGIIVTVMMLMCMLASVMAEYVTHFAFDEQHSSTGARPPGARSIPVTHHTFYDASEHGFGDVDVDGDGEASAAELSAHASRVEFARFDEDGDGKLAASEVEEAPVTMIRIKGGAEDTLTTLRTAYTEYFEEVFDRYDEDGDFELTEEEYEVAQGRLEAGKVDEVAASFLELVGVRIEEQGWADRNELDDFIKPLRAQWCPSVDKCAIGEQFSGRFTDIFSVKEAEDFIRLYDGDDDGRLAQVEFPGVPEPHTHMLGTDDLGRDLFTRILYGGRISFAVGLLATLVSFLIGVSYGAIAGYAGGWVDNVMMRFVDVLYGLPFMFVVILLMVIVGQEIYLLFIALGAVQWLTMSRIVRGQVISLKGQEFVEAARSIGVSPGKIVFRHLIPNALGPIIVYVTLTVPAVMLEEAFLSFLGLGVKAPDASWGTLASDGAKAIATYPWLIIYPGLALALTLLSLNFLGDGLRDALDPRMKKD